MNKALNDTSMIKRAIQAIGMAAIPAVVLLAGCNAPPPPPQAEAPAAPTRTVVVERPVVEQPSVTLDIHAHDDDQRRRDEEQHRRDEEQRQHDHDGPH